MEKAVLWAHKQTEPAGQEGRGGAVTMKDSGVALQLFGLFFTQH